MEPTSEIERQIEAAVDFRGHVTITFTSGESLVGYVFNRAFARPGAKEAPYIEVIPKDSEERKRFPVSAIRSVELTGKDYAAGNSFEDYLRKKSEGKK